jgi:glycosyltransferase involved in cell wall biosynthesis
MKVSIIVPCYNQSFYLPETLRSVLTQTYSNWECVIVNDGSTDKSEDIALQFCSTDKRFRYFKKENSGVSDTRNYAIAHSQGDIILPLDGDDLISPDYLEKAVEVFSSNTDVKVVYSQGEFFDQYHGVIALKPYKYETLLLENTFFNSVFFRKIDLERVGGYSVAMKKGWEDWELLIRLLDETSTVVKLPGVHYFYRILSGSRERSITDEQKKELFLQIYKNNKATYDAFFPDNIYYTFLWNKVKNENEVLRSTLDSLRNSKKYKLILFISKLLKK